MNITRKLRMNVEFPELGDILRFKLMNGTEIEAIAVKRESNGMVFMLRDCLPETRTMNDIIERGLDDIEESFPWDIRRKLVPFADGRKFRLPTLREIFGENFDWAESEAEEVERFPIDKHDVVAFRNRCTVWYWLSNRSVGGAAGFAVVSADGDANHYNASYALGVRPLFKISNL